METLYFLIPLAIIIVIVGVALFMWSVKSGQFEDLEGPGFRILMDDDDDLIPDEAKQKKVVADKPANQTTDDNQ